jgi:hypothetical protein
MRQFSVALSFLFMASLAGARSRTAGGRIDAGARLGPLEIDRFALGQGGLSEEPTWADRAAEIRALKPRSIRLFIQEYRWSIP